ncbi:MAG: TerB family tellurite resistance protein [Lentimicrobiaceae bacterium]|nr:TerB family tellurite resistance protein [Lentimicrobiaceae bacterium]
MFGKWIGSGLGWTLGGPIGALAGFVLGTLFDLSEKSDPNARTFGNGTQTTPNDYLFSLIVLVSAVLNADGKIMKSELNYVKEFFKVNFGADGAQNALRILHDLTKQKIQVTDVCQQIKNYMDYPGRLQLIHFLFGIAASDGQIHPDELKLIRHISINLGISTADYTSIEAMMIPKTDWAYDVLEIVPSATDEEVKKSYRKMALKYHPDKVSYLGEEIQQAANEKFKKVNEAYQLISKERKL